MSKPTKRSRPRTKPNPTVQSPERSEVPARFPFVWLAVLLALTGALFWPMLHNEFTNWDDHDYVLNNPLLPGPDWPGILSKPVVSNYHPLTVLSLAMNYAMTQLRPVSYLATNWVLHLANTGLVFYFIWVISSHVGWAALFTALVFAIHPMHVESVAWVSERKDLLYTLFYLLAMLSYWRYLRRGRRLDYWLTFGQFVLSLLSKPAAVSMPFSLLLLDYWHGRRLHWRLFWNKIPFLALGFLLGVVTILVQSGKAMVPLEQLPVVGRILFGFHGLTTYLGRFFYPAPLSAFHPYPASRWLGWPVLLAPVLVALSAIALWYFRKQKAVVFGILFYVVNIALVVQFIPIGNTLFAERYTYVPYIGLAFALAMWVAQKWPAARALRWGLVVLVAGAFAYPTHQRTRVWKNSETLWSDVLRKFPGTPVACSNRANYYANLSLLPANANRHQELLELVVRDCDAGLATQPNHYASLDTRCVAYLRLDRPEAAWEDANRMVQVKPDNVRGYLLRGSAFANLRRFDEALADYEWVLRKDPNHVGALNGKGSVLFNGKQAYTEALAAFDKAISVRATGISYLNRSRCYYQLQEYAKAREDAEAAARLGEAVPPDYLQLVRQAR